VLAQGANLILKKIQHIGTQLKVKFVGKGKKRKQSSIDPTFSLGGSNFAPVIFVA
jgi:hypothetical protein